MAQQLSHPAPIEVTSTTTTDHENSVSERLIIPTWLSSSMTASCPIHPNSFRAENSQGSSNRPVRGGESRGVIPYRTPTAGDRRVLGCEAADGVPVTGGGLLPASLWVLERHDGRLWQIVALATTVVGCREFLGPSFDGPAVPAG